MSEVSVKRVEVSGDLVTTEQLTDYKGLVFTPDSIDWVVWRWEDGRHSCVAAPATLWMRVPPDARPLDM